MRVQMTLFKWFSQSKNKSLEKVKALQNDVAWLDGFSLGFSKAWDMMVPLMTDGVTKMKDSIKSSAIDDCLENLESTIKKRIESANQTDILPVNEILAKKKVFENKLSQVKTEDDRKKYTNYLEIIHWVTNDILPKTK